MSAAAAIQVALALIDAPHRWAKEAMALDSTNKEVKPLSDRAKRFCVIGALQRVQCSTTEYGEAVRLLRRECGKESIFEFNDSHGHRAVKSLMKRAIRAGQVSE